MRQVLIILFSILLSCNENKSHSTGLAVRDSIPEGAIPFEYDFKMKKQIMIPGTLNDSIPMRYMLETGARTPIFSDSLHFEKKDSSSYEERVYSPMKVRMGNWEKTYGDVTNPAYYVNKNHQRANGMHLLFVWYGDNAAYIPWQFFEGRIIEISFSKLYIREIEDVSDLSEFDVIKMEYKNRRFGIPVVISTLGKEIKETLVFDTGFNGRITLNRNLKAKYNIEADYVKTDTPDTLKIGNNYLTDKNYIGFPSERVKKEYPFSGLLGTQVLQNFDMILDLKNYYLYLKPVKK